MKRFLPIFGCLAIALGLARIMPDVAQWNELGSLPRWSPVLLGLGVLITGSGAALSAGFLHRHSH